MNLMSQGGQWLDVLNDVYEERTMKSPEKIAENVKASHVDTPIVLPCIFLFVITKHDRGKTKGLE